MPQPDHVSVLGVPDAATLDDDLKAIWAKCVEKLGFVPNVYAAYSLRPQRLRNFMLMYNEIMLAPSGSASSSARWWQSSFPRRTAAITAWWRMAPPSGGCPAMPNSAR
jgi:hypothetical protein